MLKRLALLVPMCLVALLVAAACNGDSNNSMPTTPTTTPPPTTPPPTTPPPTTPTAATITGTVTDASGGTPVAGATVTAVGPSAAIAAGDETTTTGADGTYTLTGLAAGTITLNVQHQGHRNFSDTLTVAAGDNSRNVAIVPALVAAAQGMWAGSWTNTTFGSSGAASMEVTADTIAQTLTGVFDLGGGVFGAGDPAPETHSASYTDMGGTFTATSPFYGDISVTMDGVGTFSGSATNVPQAGIDRVDFTGMATTTTITATATITFTGGGSAMATYTLAKAGGNPSLAVLLASHVKARVTSFLVR